MTDKTTELTTSQSLANQQSFQPTAKQIEWLELAIQLKTDSPTEINNACEDLGITTDKRSWYDWKKIPGFTQWFYSEWRERRKEWLGELDAIGMKFAKKGSVEHWKTMRQAIGEDTDNKGSVQNNIQINVDKYVKEV